ncbi:glycosyltransferase family protein [Aestuariirhabdus haliotis]|uniref:hypothetical protein n=1 Tax=Aestuariirhabdus haliotis TaxID=2918751 RepID=UPI0020BD9F53|nr:hypothetical protein [Aestuariirhabdus haliotis]MCL6419725.1 hypothetical protein [Aestuariirhabdus haliotis]
MTRGVLLICQHFVPYTPSVGGVARVVYLSRFLVANGINTTVLSSDGVNYGDFGFSKNLAGVNVTYLRDPLKSSVQSSLRIINKPTTRHKGFFMSILRISKSILNRLVIPDLGLLMVYKYYKAASKLIESGSIDTVFVSTPPHSMQLVGGFLKWKFGNKITLIADYRDSWNTSTIFAPVGPVSGFFSRKMEKFSLARADIVTFVSEPMISKLDKMFPDLYLVEKGLLVMNGFAGDPCSFTIPKFEDPIRIGYFGMADDDPNGYRDVEPLLNLTSTAVRSGLNIKLFFYGTLRLSHLNIADYPYVEICEPIAHSDVHLFMQSMDYLLLLHTNPKNSDEVVTGKLFDYLQARRPIICYSPEDMEAARIIKKFGLGVWADIQSTDQAIEVLQGLKFNHYPVLQDEQIISTFSRDGQYLKILERLRDNH